MPVFMDDPSVLTKERLKSELLAHNVELPGGNPPRDVYVQLYVKTLSAQSHGTDATRDGFSSDEELPPPPVTRRSRSSGRKSEAARLDVTLLTDEALRDQLLVHGVHAGPIVASTRKLYEKKLQKLQDKGAVLSEPQKNHSSSQEAELYSDQEEEPTADTGPRPAPEPEPVPEQKDGVRSRRNNISQRLSSSQHSTTEKVQKVEQVEKIQTDPPPEEDPAVPELSFTGLTASCRRPIKGAAGRPVILSNRSQSAHTEIKVSNSTSSITNTANPALSSAHSAPSYTSPASSRATPTLPDASAPSARQAKAQGGISWWKKLLLWAVLAGFLFLVYQAMETNSAAPFEEAKEM